MSRYGSGKDTTDGYRKIDVRFLRKHGYLAHGASFTLSWSRNSERAGWIQCQTIDDSLILRYRHRCGDGDEWKSEEYPVRISRTRCNYGGERPWLHCPALGCDRRVAILYGGRIFACRQCYQLAYECQREAPHFRALRRAQGIHEKLGGTGIIAHPVFKPKGMHWRTYSRQLERLQEEESRAVPQWLLRHLNHVQ
jgi:hypothetical protein